jgi:hypothetical protein
MLGYRRRYLPVKTLLGAHLEFRGGWDLARVDVIATNPHCLVAKIELLEAATTASHGNDRYKE